MLVAGRSNSIYLHAGGADAFINPGSDSKYRRITQPFLRYQGVNRLRLFQSCRQDADHEGCLRQLERQFTCVSAKNGAATRLRLKVWDVESQQMIGLAQVRAAVRSVNS